MFCYWNHYISIHSSLVENNLLDKVFSSVCCIHDEKDFIDGVVKGVNMYTWIPGLQKTVQLQAITMVKEPRWFEKLYWPPKKSLQWESNPSPLAY